MRFLLLVAANLLALALACPLASAAQSAPVSSHRFYAGLSATLASYKLPDYIMPGAFSPSFTAGTQLSPRLALQVSVANYKSRNVYVHDYAGSMPLPVAQTTTTSLQVVAFPVLFRYQLGQFTDKRFQLGLLGGLTIAYTASDVDYMQVLVATQKMIGNVRNTHRDSPEVYLPLGACLRFRVAPNLDLATEVTGQWPLTYTRVNSLGFNDAFSTARSLGVHYHLGARL